MKMYHSRENSPEAGKEKKKQMITKLWPLSSIQSLGPETAMIWRMHPRTELEGAREKKTKHAPQHLRYTPEAMAGLHVLSH